MNVFYIIANSSKSSSGQEAERIRTLLEGMGKKCYFREVEAGNAGAYRYTDANAVPEDTECVLVLGGDGTLLQASRDLADRDIPLLGINLGTLGYLAEIEIQNVEDALRRIAQGEYSIENRMMLTGAAHRQKKMLMQDVALNDIVIARRGHLRVVDFQIYVNDSFLCAYRADGIILSTATGSTGYSLSAGGPIVSPDASLILMTAIAPHTLNSRTIVLPDDVKITVQIGGRPFENGDGAEVTFDGDTTLGLNVGDVIEVKKAERITRLVKVNNTSFVEILRKKMN